MDTDIQEKVIECTHEKLDCDIPLPVWNKEYFQEDIVLFYQHSGADSPGQSTKKAVTILVTVFSSAI